MTLNKFGSQVLRRMWCATLVLRVRLHRHRAIATRYWYVHGAGIHNLQHFQIESVFLRRAVKFMMRRVGRNEVCAIANNSTCHVGTQGCTAMK